MTSQSKQQIMIIQILPNISKSENIQTMKVFQLIEYNMRNISLEKSSTRVVEKLVPDPFIKNRN